MLIFFKLLFLFLAVLFGFINIAKINYRQDIGLGNTVLMTIGIVGFLALQFGLI